MGTGRKADSASTVHPRCQPELPDENKLKHHDQADATQCTCPSLGSSCIADRLLNIWSRLASSLNRELNHGIIDFLIHYEFQFSDTRITILSEGSTRLYGSVQPRAPEVCILADRDRQREINATISEDS